MVEPAMNEDRWGPKNVASASEYLKAKPSDRFTLYDPEIEYTPLDYEPPWEEHELSDSTHMKRRDDVDQKTAREQRWKWLPRTRRGH